ncbi:MAG: nuclear transport factor 2 family protein [Cytophagales bacterium]|nr:nuclear transport factor 2 family protein [Cytophagales bacterium]
MKTTLYSIIPGVILCIMLLSCNSGKEKLHEEYVPEDKELYEAVVAIDKLFFDAYNRCDLDVQAGIYSDSIEFFHDQGGLSTSKQDILDATRKNICGKVTRELVPGSVEVYPIKNYGAVQTGLHKFYNKEEPDAESKPSKFIVVWKNEGGTWKMAKVISLH